MSTLREKLDQADQEMRTLKEQYIADQPKEPEMPIYLHFWRGEMVIAGVAAPLDRDKTFPIAHIGATGFSADVMAVSFEAWSSPLHDSPLTGKPWRRGEMQFVAKTEPDAFKKGWLAEVLTTSIHDRSGKFYLSRQPFLVADDKVVWGERDIEPKEDEDEIEGSGLMFENYQHAMSLPSVRGEILAKAEKESLLKQLMDSMPEEAQWFHSDMATLKIIVEQTEAKGVMLFAEEGSLRHQMLEERMKEGGFEQFGDVEYFHKH